MKDILELEVPVEERQVDVVHILNDGQVILSKKELQVLADKFEWIKPKEISNLVEQLKPQTDPHRKSIIAIFETREIKTYPNVSMNFHQYSLLNKSGL
jgi:hypothetical protein